MNVRNHRLQSALHLAVRQAHVRLVLLLVDAGCSVNAEDEEGDTALHVALRHHQSLLLAADGAGGDPGPLQLLSRVRKCGPGCRLPQGLSGCPRPSWVTAQGQALSGCGSLGDCRLQEASSHSMASISEILCS